MEESCVIVYPSKICFLYLSFHSLLNHPLMSSLIFDMYMSRCENNVLDVSHRQKMRQYINRYKPHFVIPLFIISFFSHSRTLKPIHPTPASSLFASPPLSAQSPLITLYLNPSPYTWNRFWKSDLNRTFCCLRS